MFTPSQGLSLPRPIPCRRPGNAAELEIDSQQGESGIATCAPALAPQQQKPFLQFDQAQGLISFVPHGAISCSGFTLLLFAGGANHLAGISSR